MIQEFNIKQGATLPILVMRLNKDNYFLYEEFYNALENSTITFSMFDVENNSYRITKQRAGIILKEPCVDCLVKEEEYYIYYKFSEKDTNKIGRYKGEFKIEFYDTEESNITGTFIAPINDDLYINIVSSLFNEYNRSNRSGNDIFNNTFTEEFN